MFKVGLFFIIFTATNINFKRNIFLLHLMVVFTRVPIIVEGAVCNHLHKSVFPMNVKGSWLGLGWTNVHACARDNCRWVVSNFSKLHVCFNATLYVLSMWAWLAKLHYVNVIWHKLKMVTLMLSQCELANDNVSLRSSLKLNFTLRQ